MISEQFRRLVTAPVSTPATPPELDAALAEAEHLEPEDLPAMIELVREAEMSCMQMLKECGRRTRTAQEAAHTDEWPRTIQLLARQREVMEWDMRIKWLQAVRQHLAEQQRGSEVAWSGA